MDKDFSDMMSKFSDMMGNFSSGTNTNSNQSSSFSQNNSSFNFDINTFIKLKSVMDSINSQPDPRSNLLKSLKPYLKENRQAKIDQYINLFSMSRVMDAFKQAGDSGK